MILRYSVFIDGESAFILRVLRLTSVLMEMCMLTIAGIYDSLLWKISAPRWATKVSIFGQEMTLGYVQISVL